MDIFDKCLEFTKATEYRDKGLYPYFIPIADNHGPRVNMNGKEMLMIGSNNYLGLTKDPRVEEAAIKAIEKYGTSCSGSRFLNGTLELHVEAEHKLAKFIGKESALMFTTGYLTNFGSVSTLLDRKSVIISDRTNHACINDGILLAKGTFPSITLKRYQHNDMDDLERVISTVDIDKPKLIATDGVFSMEGDVVQLPRLVEIAKKYNARLYIDDAHGMGVLGKSGRGTLEHFNLIDEVDLVTTTFSKSFASLGGFIAGKKEVVDFIKHFSRALIFAAAMPPANTAAVIKSLEIIETEPELVHRVQHNGAKMRREFQAMGFDTGESEHTPIVPLLVRDFDKTLAFWKALFDAGIYTNAVVPPGVPADRSLLRTTYMATHTDADLDEVLDRVKKIAKQMDII